MLTATDLAFNYPGLSEKALAGVSFTAEAGSVVGLAGHVGSGRTTLCMHLAGFVPRVTGGSSFGELSVAGVDPRRVSGERISRLVGMVFQDPAAQITQVTVLGEVMAALVNRGVSTGEAEARARALLGYVGLGDVINGVDAARKRTWELSGGQQQRVAIAAALAIDPQVLILDDASAVLDPRGKQELAEIVADLAGDKTLVVVDDVDFLASVADRIVVLAAGALCTCGPAGEVLRDAETLARAGVEPPMPLRVGRAVGARELPLTPEEFERAFASAGRPAASGAEAASPDPPEGSVEAAAPDPDTSPAHPSPQPLVHVDGVSYRYKDGTVALDATTIEVGPGQVHAIVGGNGAGKTTLTKLVVGLLKPSGGRVVVDGTDTRKGHVAGLARVIGAAFQNPDEQITERTVAEEVGFRLRRQQYERAGLFTKRARYDDAHIRERVARACTTVGLSEQTLDCDPSMLAHGQRKLVTIAAALVLDPPILVLDEPAAGLDVGARRHVNRVVTELSRRGTAVIMVEHDMDLVCEVSDTVTVMSRGVAAIQDSPRAVFAPHNHEFLGDVHIEPPHAARLARCAGVPALTYEELVAELLRVPEVR